MEIQEIVDLLQDLIRFKTMHACPEELHRCADFIESYLQRHDIGYQRIDNGGIPSVWALPRTDSAPVLLLSHIDVVDGPEPMFEPVVKDGKLYGRGSIDDKYAVALSLVLIKDFVARLRSEGKDQKDLPFGILVTGDEEIGGARGASAVLGRLKVEFGMALDGGDPRTIVVKEKGLARVRLVSEGRAAHGARPWLGENAIDNLLEDYRVIQTFFAEARPDHWHRTLTCSRIQAGASVNQVPDSAEATFDIRFTEHDDIDALLDEVRQHIRGKLVIDSRAPVYTSGQSPYLDLLMSVADQAKAGFEHGASDARYFCQRNIPSVVWGADGAMSQHTRDEHVVIDSLAFLYRTLSRFFETAGRWRETQPGHRL